jgi:hypothetical protein
MRRSIITLSFLVAISSVLFAQDNEGDGCSDVLYFAGRNYTKDTLELSVAQRVYDQYCENDSAKSGLSIDTGAEAVIKAVPFKGHGSGESTSEQLKSFCKTYNSDYRHDETRYHATSLVDPSAPNTWLACKQLAARGVLFRPETQRTAFAIEVARKGADAVAVQGIIYNSALLKCTVPSSNASPDKRVTADKDTHKALTNDYWTVSCERVAIMKDNEAVYPEADIQVITTRGTFPFTVPRDEMLPLQWASQIAEKQNVLDSQIQKLQAALPAKLATFGTSDVDQVGYLFYRGQGPQAHRCPPGQFVSEIGVSAWNSGAGDALVADINFGCRTAFPADTK